MQAQDLQYELHVLVVQTRPQDYILLLTRKTEGICALYM
jgi:hypothetical protein